MWPLGGVKCGKPGERGSPSPRFGRQHLGAGDASGVGGGWEGVVCAAQLAVEDSQPRPAPRLSCPVQHMVSCWPGATREARRAHTRRSRAAGRPRGPRRGPQGRRLDGARGQGGGGQLGAGRARSGRAGRARIGLAPPRDRPHIGRGAGGGVGCGGCRLGEVWCGSGGSAAALLERRAHLAPSDPRGAAGPGDALSAREPWSASGTSWAAAMGAPAAGSGRGAAGPALRAARAPGGCSRASGSSTSSRSHSARGPWRCTTPSRSSRTASPSTARSSSSARTTSSANTPSASPSGHILPGAGPGGGPGPPEVAGTGTGRGFRRLRLAGSGGAAWAGGLGAGVRPHAAPSGHLPRGWRRVRSGERRIGSLGEEGAGRIPGPLGAPRVRACLCFSVFVCGRGGGGRGSGVGAGRSPLPLSSSLLSLDAGAERVASLEGTRGRIGVRVGVSAGWRRARARA